MILVDANAIGFAGAAATDMRSGEQATGAVFYFIKTLADIRFRYRGPIIVLWDGRSWRYEEYPDYKGKRYDDPKLVLIKDKWKSQKPIVAKILRTMGVDQMFSANMEADDLAGRIAAAVPTGKLFVSGDKDWLQLVRGSDDRWFDPVRDRYVTLDNFSEFTGFKSHIEFVQGKALTGDMGDNIPGVGNIGPKGAQWIIETFGSVERMLDIAGTIGLSDKDTPKKVRDFVDDTDKIAIYHRNLRLMDLCRSDLPAMRDRTYRKGVFDRDAFITIAGELAFHSILRDVDRFLLPFAPKTELAA